MPVATLTSIRITIGTPVQYAKSKSCGVMIVIIDQMSVVWGKIFSPPIASAAPPANI